VDGPEKYHKPENDLKEGSRREVEHADRYIEKAGGIVTKPRTFLSAGLGRSEVAIRVYVGHSPDALEEVERPLAD
jgi:hypothetical protein